jgi:hypothetical protein
VLLALAGRLPRSEFLDMSLVFAAVAAIPFWYAGREWRSARLNRATQAPAAPIRIDSPGNGAAGPLHYRYPAIAACICEDRRPAPAEVKTVASRIWRESFAAGNAHPSFAVRRVLLRAAKASLEGS